MIPQHLTSSLFTESAAQSKRLLSTAWKLLSPADVKRFQEALGELLDDEATLKMSLLPLLSPSTSFSASQVPAKPSANSSIQESLIRFMLELPKLQTVLLLRLIEKLPMLEYVESDALEENIPKLLLSQIRWLPWVENSTDVAQAFMNAIDLASSTSLKRDIITWIPETADDASADVLVPKLVSLMESEPELLGAAIDTLSNIKLSESHLDQVQVSAIELLNTVDPEYVPVLVKFLFHVAKLESLPKLFKDLRQQLKVETLSEGAVSAATGGNTAALDSTSLLVECLRACLRAKSERATAFLQEFTSFSPKEDKSAAKTTGAASTAPSGPQHSILDIWLFFLVHASFPNMRPKLELALRKKLLGGQLKAQLLRRAITIRPRALEDLFPTVMEVAQALMQQSHQDITRTVEGVTKAVYIAIFHVSDMSMRQAILGQLMAHVSSASIKEARGALRTLEHLVTSHAQLIEPFASYLQGLIDFMDGSQLDNSLLLQVYFIFSKLAYPRGALSYSQESETKTAEFLTMLLLKQNGNHETRYRQMGALGSAALICVLGAPIVEGSAFGANAEALEDVPARIAAADKRIDEILRTWSQLHAPEAQELFLDELSASLTSKARDRPLRREVTQQIAAFCVGLVSNLMSPRSDAVTWALSRGFASDTSTDSQLSVPTSSTMWCEVLSMWPREDPSFEEMQTSTLLFNLFMEETNSLTSHAMLPGRMATCAALIRLLFVSHEATGALEDIYLVFYASFQLFPRPIAVTPSALHAYFNSQTPKTLELIACQLIHAINIMRELLNIAGRLEQFSLACFAVPSQDYAAVRLAQLVQLEAYLDCVLDHIPDFPQFPGGSKAQLPLIHAADILREQPALKKSGRKKAGGVVKKGPKATPAGKKKKESDANMDLDESESDADDTEEEEEENETATGAGADASTTEAPKAQPAPLTKSWGNLGAFDVKKYRRNVLERVSSRLRPLLPSALSLLSFVSAHEMDNQAKWMLVSDLVEKIAAMAPRQPSLNPAKHKPDAPWLRAYADHSHCLIELLPALRALPKLLLVALERDASPPIDDVVSRRSWPISLPPSVGAFGSPSLCYKLRYPCAKIVLGLLKSVFAQHVFYAPLVADSAVEAPGDTARTSVTPAQDIARALLSGIPAQDGEAEAQTHSSWAEYVQACSSRLSSLVAHITDFETVVAVIEVLKELASGLETEPEMRAGLQDQASALSSEVLCRHWTDQDGEPSATNSIFREGVKGLPVDGLEKVIAASIWSSAVFAENAGAMAKELRNLVGGGKKKQNKADDDEPEEEEARYLTLTRATAPTFIKALQSAATRLLEAYSPSGTDLTDEDHSDGDAEIQRLNQLVTFCPFLLENALPSEPDRALLGMVLKQGKLFVEAFHGKLDWIAAQATHQPVAVMKTMRTYQRANRALQALCTTVKEGQFKQLGSLIAPLKRSMEMVLTKMRLLSDKHGFGDALDVRVSTAATGSASRPSARNGNAHEGAGTASAALPDAPPANLKKRKHVSDDERDIDAQGDETEATLIAKRRA